MNKINILNNSVPKDSKLSSEWNKVDIINNNNTYSNFRNH